MRSPVGCEAKLSCKTLTQGVIMNKTDIIGLGIIGLIAIIGLLVVSCIAVKRDNYTIEQSDNLEKICLKVYKTDLKNDSEIKELCKNVKVKLFEDR